MLKIRLNIKRISHILRFIFGKKLKISSDIFHTEIKDSYYSVNEEDVHNFYEAVRNTSDDFKGFNKNDSIHSLFFTKISWKIIENLNDYLEIPIDPKILKTIVHQSEYFRYFNAFKIPGKIKVKSKIWQIQSHRKGTNILINFDYYSDDQLIASEYSGGLLFGVKYIGENQNFEEIPNINNNSDKILWQKQAKIDSDLSYLYAEKAEIDAPIHTDPTFAKSLGLPDIILQGTCTLAKSINLIVSENSFFKQDEIESISGRFSGILVPPDNITVRVFTDNKQMIIFDVINDSGEVVIKGGHIKYK